MPPRINRSERSFNTWQEAYAKFGSIDDRVKLLFRQPRFEQRSQAWFDARFGALTASDMAAAIGKNAHTTCQLLVKKKCGLTPPFKGNRYTRHGVLYEDAAVFAYERKMKEDGDPKTVLDFGLLSHTDMFWAKPDDVSPEEWHHFVHQEECPPNVTAEEWEKLIDLRWLKGSPDGVTTDGVLIEVKCPSKTIITQHISELYYPQVQLLLELTNLEIAHFIQYRPQTNWLFAEELDVLVVRRDPSWFKEAKEVARHTWNSVLAYRRTNVMPQVVNQYLDNKLKRKVVMFTEEECEQKRVRLTPMHELYDMQDDDDSSGDETMGDAQVPMDYEQYVRLMRSHGEPAVGRDEFELFQRDK